MSTLKFIFMAFGALVTLNNYAQKNENSKVTEPTQKLCNQKGILELNPLLFVNQGIGLNSEANTAIPQLYLAAHIAYYHQKTYDESSVVARNKIISFGLTTRYYFLDKSLPVGPFAGIEISYSAYEMSIQDQTEIMTVNNYFWTPSIYAGYRFIASNGFTLSGYVGGGYKIFSGKISSSPLPSDKQNDIHWQRALNVTNPAAKRFAPEFGLTVGYYFETDSKAW